MGRRCHVVAVTPDLDRVLVFLQPGGWLLPFFDDNPRLALPLQVQGLVSRFATTATLVHEAPLVDTSGATSDSHHVCYVALTSGPVILPHARLVSPEALLNQPAFLALHQQALRSTLWRLHHPVAPFDSAQAIAHAWRWCAEAAANAGRGRIESCKPHRCARYEYVASAQTSTCRAYFKGGPHRADDEARLTMLLWDLAPQSFPDTIALDIQNKRWLYEELSGELLTGPTFTESSVTAAVRALGCLQRQASTSTPIERHLRSRALRALDLVRRTDEIVRGLPTTSREHDMLFDEWGASQARRERTAHAIDDLALPMTLVLSDFWSRNILVTPHGIGFIDVERSYWSYPFLALTRLLREAELRLPGGTALRPILLETFVELWREVVEPPVMRRGVAHLGEMGRWFNLMLASAELDTEERALGDALPPGYRLGRLSKHIRAAAEAS